MRLLAISDIHGQLDKFKQLLQLCNYDKNKDQLILLGDYTDRGYQNIDTLKYIIDLKRDGAIVLKGNHDELTQGTIYELLTGNFTGNLQCHMNCGGENTVQELIKCNSKDLYYIYNFIKDLPTYYEYEKYIFSHSGVDSTKSFNENTSSDLLWSRWDFINSKAYKDKIVIFGHTVTFSINMMISKQNPTIWKDSYYKDKIGIDCGSVFGGKLCCYSVLEDKAYYV